MSTAQRQKEKTGTWSQIFPNEQVSAQQSALFVKKLLAVAVSNITYLRAIFPEYAFGDRCLEDLNLKILKDDGSCSGACQVIQWVKGCFDALDKKFLKMLTIGIYTDPDNSDTVIESYTFKFSYNDDAGVEIYRNKDKISSAHSAAETKKATIRLLRTIVILTQSLHSLPDDVFMTMKLLYYDDVTPPDYEPPGFQQATTEGFNFDEEPMNIKVGDVITPFHTVKLRIKTDGKQFETNNPLSQPELIADEPIEEEQAANIGLDDEDEAMEESTPIQWEPVSENVPMSSRALSKDTGLQVVPEPTEGDCVPITSPNQPGSDMRAISTTGSQQISQQSEEVYGVKCGCGYNEDDGLMIMCAQCKTWQHAVCYRVLKEDEAPEKHICDSCANPQDPDFLPTDPHLQGLTPIAKEATCLWRRTLSVCQETSKIMVPSLAKRLGVETTVAHGLLSRLEKEGYVKPSRGKRHGKSVDKQLLEKGIKKYFNEVKEENVSDKFEPKKFEEQMNNVNKEIDRITARAETINLEGKRPSVKEQHSPKNQEQLQLNGTQTESRKGKKRVKSTSGEIDEITARAQTINLKGKRRSTKENHPQKRVEQLSQSQSDSQNESRKGKKRVKPTLSKGDFDFEISNSQDVSQEIYPKEPSKRRKSSVARKSIRV